MTKRGELTPMAAKRSRMKPKKLVFARGWYSCWAAAVPSCPIWNRQWGIFRLEVYGPREDAPDGVSHWYVLLCHGGLTTRLAEGTSSAPQGAKHAAWKAMRRLLRKHL